uniref:AA_permease domain-containing protein n=1 Tax=Ascaris lumbricoides TaxID=6252 RepID=A0A0M3IHY3_ASCLU
MCRNGCLNLWYFIKWNNKKRWIILSRFQFHAIYVFAIFSLFLQLDPARDVPLGMFTSIGVCSLFNLIAVFISGATMLRDVSGLSLPVYDNVTHHWTAYPCAANFSCKYGLMNFFQVAELEAAWGPLIIAGIFAMSLSSTMTNLDNGPQIFQVFFLPFLHKNAARN